MPELSLTFQAYPGWLRPHIGTKPDPQSITNLRWGEYKDHLTSGFVFPNGTGLAANVK